MSTAMYAVVDPSTGELVKEYPTATDEQIEQAVAAATKAHREWGRGTSVADRAALIRRVAELHTERKDELAKIIQREMGKPYDQSVGEVEFSASIYEYYADNAEKFLADEPITLLDGEGSALIRRSSVGVLLGIMPWNYPYYQVARFAGPNLTLGNTILHTGDSLDAPCVTYAHRAGHAHEPAIVLADHERAHVFQYMVLGPLFLPLYLAFGGVSVRNRFERAADRYALTGTGWWPWSRDEVRISSTKGNV